MINIFEYINIKHFGTKIKIIKVINLGIYLDFK